MDGSAAGPAKAPTGKRLASAVIDLVVIPVFLGLLIGFLTVNLEDATRNIILIVANWGWLFVRDLVFSPGRAMVGLKIISLTGSAVSPIQVFVRNVFLLVPILLLIGYPLEFIMILARGERLADGWAKTRVVQVA